MIILITDVKMPTCCDECAFVKTVGLDRWKCELSGCDFNSWDVGWADGTENKYIRHSSCPLVEVPPHGRLIDVDAVLDGLAHKLGIRSLDYLIPSERAIVSWFKDAPTIIPAEEKE